MRTLVVKLDNVELGLVLDLLSEEGLGGLAVWAVGLGEDNCEVLEAVPEEKGCPKRDDSSPSWVELS